MVKILLGVMGLLIISGGAFFLLKGSGTGDMQGSLVASTTPLNLSVPKQEVAVQPTSEATPPAPSVPVQAVNTKKIMQATLHTSMGDITIKFYPEQAPNTVANFLKLASEGFYNETKFHRVIKDFMDQGGDPLSKDDSKQAQWGMGGPGYKFNDEISATNSNVAGSVAMANSGPNTQGSQFFINAKDNHFLDPNYTVFGQVTSGMDVVLAINNVKTAPGDRPVVPVVLKSITLQ